MIFVFAVRGFVTGSFQTAYVYTPEVCMIMIKFFSVKLFFFDFEVLQVSPIWFRPTRCRTMLFIHSAAVCMTIQPKRRHFF